MMTKRVILPTLKRLLFMWAGIGLFWLAAIATGQAQNRLPRQLNNPDAQVTFDRTTSYNRAMDVLNNFSQKFTGKALIDRSQISGNLDITVPPMNWRDALDLILKAKYLRLVGHKTYFEIVSSNIHSTPDATPPISPDTSLTTHSKEVRINAIFFQGNRTALQEVGVDWSTLTNNVPSNVGSYLGGGGSSGGGSGGGSGNGDLPSKFNAPFVSVNAKGAKSVSQDVFNALINFGKVFGSGISVQALFSAFQADNLGKILASPSVRVLNGEEGHIQVGQDFSIKQKDFAGNTTDKFFSVGTILDVTPQIIVRGDTTFIHLNIDATKSSANPGATSVVIDKQNATTQALLLNHEATVIAGLYRTETTKVRRGVPILKDLPPWFFGLRYLFGYNSETYRTQELVILIQASIVPSIPERMNHQMPGKFEKLQQERNRIHKDVEKYRRLVKDADDSDTQLDSLMEKEPQKERRKKRQTPESSLRKRSENTSLPPNFRVVNSKNPISNYYVIGGSFKNQENAQSFAQRLRSKGYKPQLLVSTPNEFYMVAYKGFDDRSVARDYLQHLRTNGLVDPWIYNN